MVIITDIIHKTDGKILSSFYFFKLHSSTNKLLYLTGNLKYDQPATHGFTIQFLISNIFGMNFS